MQEDGLVILKRCKKRHFYDSNKFDECPYCAIEKSGLEEETKEFSLNSGELTEEAVEQSVSG